MTTMRYNSILKGLHETVGKFFGWTAVRGIAGNGTWKRNGMKKVVVAMVFSGVMGFASEAFAAGFALIEQGVSGLGTAYAGAGATAEDATTVFYNPAGLTRLPGKQAAGAVHVIVPYTKFRQERASNILGMPISGGNGGNAGETGVVPNLYFAGRLGDRLAAGLGISVPYGLATSYEKTWVGRYHAVDSEVKTLNINPALAYQVTERLSLGVGVSAQYIDVNLSNMVDFGLASVSKVLAEGNFEAAAVLQAAGVPSNPDADVFADLNADDWSYGFNLGALCEFSDATRLGVSYRSRIKHAVKGKGEFTLQNPSYLAGFGLEAAARDRFVNQRVSGNVTLPASASVSLYHALTPRWKVMADVLWTEWSRFEALVIKFETLPTSVTTQNWRDTWRYSLGTTYRPGDKLTLRLGSAYDETVIRRDADRTPRIPDQRRFWTAFGVGYRFSDRLSLDFGYAHLFVSGARIDKVAAPDNEDAGRGALKGEYTSHVDIVSLQLAYSF